MAGKPFQVGRFAHTLRVRLMREHLGIDVDALDEEMLMNNEPAKPEYEQEKWIPEEDDDGYLKQSQAKTPLRTFVATVVDGANQGKNDTL